MFYTYKSWKNHRRASGPMSIDAVRFSLLSALRDIPPHT
jgi:hypothetical protein